MLHMRSRSDNDGSYQLTVMFAPGVDPDHAISLVAERVKLAESVLPDAVRKIGVSVKRQSPTLLAFVVISSARPDKHLV